MRGSCLELAIGGCTQLQGPELLHPGIGLAERAQAQDPDHDEHGDDADEREEELAPDTPRHARDRADESVVVADERSPVAGDMRLPDGFRPGHHCLELDRTLPTAQGWRTGVAAARFVITHLPAIFSTS